MVKYSENDVLLSRLNGVIERQKKRKLEMFRIFLPESMIINLGWENF